MSELREQIQNVIENEPVALFMKGTPQFVMCGNSDRALRALRNAGAPVTAVDILPDPTIRQELSAISGWPTIPQVFVKGELIGGADIVEELASTGELEQKLASALGDDYGERREERVLVERGVQQPQSAKQAPLVEAAVGQLDRVQRPVDAQAHPAVVQHEHVVGGHVA